jgi:hypothetical protein
MKPGDEARQALHDMRWGPHIADMIERQNRVDDAIKIALTTIAKLETALKSLSELDGIVFASDDKQRPMIAQSVVRQIARGALGQGE